MGLVVRKTLGKRPLFAKKVNGNVVPGGGGGTYTSIGGVNEAFPVLVGSTNPSDPYVKWIGVANTKVEGDSVLLRVEASNTSNVTRACPVVLDPASTVPASEITFSRPYVLIPALQQYGTLLVDTSVMAGGAGVSRTAILKLDPTAPLLGFTPGNEPPIIETDPNKGPDTFTLTVLNNTAGGGFPTFSWGNGNLTIVEGNIIPFQLRLSEAADDLVRIRVQVTAGTAATPGVTFDPIDRVETFQVGETEKNVEVNFPFNPINSPDASVNVAASYVSGSVDPGSPTSFVVTVTNQTGNSITPRVRFTTVSQGVVTGNSTKVRASLTTAAGGATSFSTTRGITVTSSFLAGATEDDFAVTWPLATNQLVFVADSPNAEFDVEVSPTASSGEGVQFTIADDGTGDYIVPPANEGGQPVATVTAIVPGTEPTDLNFESHEGVFLRVIQGSVAVVPPSTSLPALSLTNSKRCQVVGLKKNGEGLWSAAYFYGQTDGTQSTPARPGALGIRRTETQDTLPAFNDTFPGAQDIDVFMQVANVPELYECVLGPSGFGGQGILTGEGGFFPEQESGMNAPRLCRETFFRSRPRKVTDPPTTPSIFDESGDACGMLELYQTEYTADEGVIVCHGRFFNGAWAASEDPKQVNKYCDGEINMIRLQLRAPGGWVIDFVDPHPLQSQSAASTVNLLQERGVDYHFPTCSQHQFWFILRRIDDPTAQVRGRDYLRMRHIAFAVGELGPTRQAYWGEADELLIDYERAGLAIQGSSNTGYDAIRQIGNEQALGRAGVPPESDGGGELPKWVRGLRQVDGTSVDDNSTGQSYDGTRRGWWYGMGPSGAGEAGGVQIHGSSAIIPSWGWWIRHRILLCGMMNRNRFAYRDVINDAAGYWWTHATTVNGQPVITTHGTTGARKGYHRPWHFHTDRITDFQFDNGGDWTAYRLAPNAGTNVSRPWNTPENADPDEFWMYHFEQIAMTHIARIRQGCNDMWYGCRNWLAYRSLEEVAAYMTRTYAPVDAVDQPSGFHRQHDLPGYIIPRFANFVAVHGGNGYWGDAGYYASGGAVTRGYAWAALMMAGWYAIAVDNIRTKMFGGTLSGNLAGKSVLGSYWDFIDAVTTEAGLFSRTTSHPSPDLYDFRDPTNEDQTRFEFPNFQQRRGALPLAPEFPDDQAPYQLHFHQMFFLKAISAWKRNVWSAQFSSRYAELDRVLRYHEYYTAGARTYTVSDRDALVPYGLLTAFTDRPAMSNLNNQPVSAAVTLPETLAGSAAANGGSFWQFFEKIFIPGNPPTIEVAAQESGYENHYQKAAGNAYFSSRALSDPTLIELAKAVYGRNGDTAEQLFEWLFRGSSENVQSQLTSLNSGARYKNYGEWTFAASLMAYLLNLHT